MKKNKKIPLLILAVLAVLAFLAFLLSYYVSQEIRNQLENNAGNSFSYENLDVDLLRKRIDLTGFEFNRNGTSISSAEIKLKGFNYFQYLLNDKIIINELIIFKPVYRINKASQKDENDDSGREDFNRSIRINKTEVKNGTFAVRENDSAQNSVFIRVPHLSIKRTELDSASVREMIPFRYSSYSAVSDSIRLHINTEHYLTVEHLEVQSGKTSVENFKILPYYSKSEFDQRIPYEKDRIALGVEKIHLEDLFLTFQNDTLLLKSPFIKVTGGNLEIYRNKLLPDDERVKSLYSKKLRESPVKLDFPLIEIIRTTIVYEEKTAEDRPPGTVEFGRIEGEITNLTNLDLQREDFPATVISAKALYMNASPVSMDWQFRVPNVIDKFSFSGRFEEVGSREINSFLKPSMNMEAEGGLKKVYFTFSGNSNTATGDVQVDYDQFKLNVLRSDGSEKNKLLSAIVNLFVENEGISKEATFNDVEFSRDKTKSFWNFMWKGVKKGVIEELGQL